MSIYVKFGLDLQGSPKSVKKMLKKQIHLSLLGYFNVTRHLDRFQKNWHYHDLNQTRANEVSRSADGA